MSTLQGENSARKPVVFKQREVYYIARPSKKRLKAPARGRGETSKR